jgi:hypothetical protein
MISLEDCIAFCGLDEDEVAAISEHEHIPEIAATALADYLLKQPHGGETIRTMITDDIHQALCAGRIKHAQELFMALRHFLDQHPEEMPSLRSKECRQWRSTWRCCRRIAQCRTSCSMPRSAPILLPTS